MKYCVKVLKLLFKVVYLKTYMYDKRIPQSQITDQPIAPRLRDIRILTNKIPTHV